MKRLLLGLALFFIVIPSALAVWVLRLDLYLYPVSRRILLHEGHGARKWVDLVPLPIEGGESFDRLQGSLSFIGFRDETKAYSSRYKGELGPGGKVFRMEIGRIVCSMNMYVIVHLDAGKVLSAKGALDGGACL